MALSVMLILPGLLSSCGNKAGHTEIGTTEDTVIDTLPNDFVVFFDRFHADSAFQMEHINFPLEGLPAYTGVEDTLLNERFFWQKSNWVKHNRFTDPGGNFEHWYLVANDRIIEHWIKMKGTNLHMKRRFAKLDDGWYLIYYQGLRPTDPENQ